ncbi:entericidin [Stenotrophomonas ginsengisoli]|uniref:Entericidin n=1 Tax=Stenotrophomonas ginsengisoli TaxID=336566 RepID=A0A0R0DJW6_9GAMM|nr:entericidin A/B family lipoprotein [Stenotrophomonas ginsengisoli]KRG77955.1 entericidin [Stenotrophomonas ginsengisoli]
MKRTLMAMTVTMFSLVLLAGCNTMAGAGKDIQKAGDKIEGAAKG